MIAEDWTNKGVKESKKVAIMLRWTGVLGKDIYFSPKEDRREDLSDVKLEDVIVQFDHYCGPFKNVPMESFKFHDIKQKEGETIEAFICRLRMLRSVRPFKVAREQLQTNFSLKSFANTVQLKSEIESLKEQIAQNDRSSQALSKYEPETLKPTSPRSPNGRVID